MDLSEANLNLRMSFYNENSYRDPPERADLSEANLRGADLTNSRLIETNFEKATLTGCKIYGISAWGLKLKQTDQSNLIITPEGESVIIVDNLEVAQFIYLLIQSKKIRDVIDNITSKVVLILGRFAPHRKAVLDAIREGLRNRGLVPIMFDFEKPLSRNFRETVMTLALMSRFIIADITQAKIILQELEAIVPKVRVPVQPLLQSSAKKFSTYENYVNYPWFLPIQRYRNIKSLLSSIQEKVIAPAEAKARELLKKG